ncbi:hypothetical protein [Marinobacterium mangrovicola]|uniref:Uncharacterized protein n=1 Tax=Marinobacterium mangrovicola TaxID=1476959 RepID=A0A4R1GK02_9GAMM|nr:hypothetical protein [Marinobacterium mangrovicola]TCK07611.1 hypothetical protein CLV83_2482 [Marinobacterium mangrovicola]
MSNIKITNNTNLPIHICMTWKGIVQYYKNDLQPGESYNFDKFGMGWSDFHAVVGTESNKFNHDQDFANILSFGAAITGVVIGVAGLVLVPFSGGSSTALVAAGTALAISSTSVSAASVAIDGINGALLPASLKAIFVSDHYDISIYGGDILGDHEKSDGEEKFVVSRIDPLRIEWKNLANGNTGIEVAPTN